MSKKTRTTSNNDGELSERHLDQIAGGQEVRKMGTIVITAKRIQPEPEVVKLGRIEVTAKKQKQPAGATHVAAVASKKK